MKKKLLSILLISIIPIGVWSYIANYTESKIHKDAPKLLELNNFKIVQENKFDWLMSQTEFIVTKNNKQDTINVQLVKGALIIQPR